MGSTASSPAPAAAPGPFPLHVKTLTGAAFTIPGVVPSDTVGAVKRRITELQGHLPEHQRIFYDGRMMDDDRTLADYKVYGEATVKLVHRLRGEGGGDGAVSEPPIAQRVE